MAERKKFTRYLSYSAMLTIIVGYAYAFSQPAIANTTATSNDLLMDHVLQLGAFGAFGSWGYIKVSDRIKEQIDILDKRLDHLETKLNPMLQWWEKKMQSAMENK